MSEIESKFVEVDLDKTLVNKVEAEQGIITRISLLEIQYKDKKKGINAYGRLFANDDGKLEFEGNVEKSARVFFEECLKPMCEKYIEELTKGDKNEKS